MSLFNDLFAHNDFTRFFFKFFDFMSWVCFDLGSFGERAFVESDFFAGVSMFLSPRRWLNNFFLSLSKVKTLQNVQQLLAVLCLLQSSVGWVISKLLFLSFSTDKLCSDLRHFEITTSKNVRIMETLRRNGEMITDARISQAYWHLEKNCKYWVRKLKNTGLSQAGGLVDS